MADFKICVQHGWSHIGSRPWHQIGHRDSSTYWDVTVNMDRSLNSLANGYWQGWKNWDYLHLITGDAQYLINKRNSLPWPLRSDEFAYWSSFKLCSQQFLTFIFFRKRNKPTKHSYLLKCRNKNCDDVTWTIFYHTGFLHILKDLIYWLSMQTSFPGWCLLFSYFS